MKILSDCALAEAAWNADFRGEGHVTIVAIALAESGGDLEAVNDTRGRTDLPPGVVPELSLSPWQINVLVWTAYDPARLVVDAAYAARCAFDVYRAQGCSAWSTYNVGAHLPFVARARVASATNAYWADARALYGLALVRSPAPVLTATIDRLDARLAALRDLLGG